ncbi:MAG TPA: type II secretion system protein [Pyrinomonadaceae bacterium]|nr:type II secretion system protein [Acidobacteriota bacterium]HQZ96176.1 type II secretion system protein [Pyrinomonadaceae bacterium]
MERSIVIGKKRSFDFRFSIFDFSSHLARRAVSYPPKIQDPKSKIQKQKGFSLLELMIAMFIMIILLSIAVPTYERSVRNAREIVLKENLFQLRRAIDQYAGDKGKLPSSVDDLVESKYLREKPYDPISEKQEWDEIQGEDPNSADGEQGLVNVKTLAPGEDVNGVPYSDY